MTMVAALRASSVGGAAVPPIYAYAVTGNGSWEGVVSSDGRRFSLPNNTLLDGGSLAFAPDRAAVTYSLPPAHGRSRIRILVLGGRNRVVVTPGPQDAPPVYAADGRVLYASGRTISYVDGPSLAAHGLPTGAVIRYVAADPVNPVVFAATVVWGSVAAGTGEEALYRITPAGATVLAAGFAAASELAEPRFSPDGSKLAFIRSGRDRGGDLYVIDVDGRQLRRLTYSTHAGGPVWSPDARRIAVTQRYGYRRHRSNGTPEVTVIDLATGRQHRVTHTPRLPPPIANAPFNGNYVTPGTVAGAWSPDGHEIAVVTQGTSLAVAPAAGGPIERVYTLPAPRVSTGVGPLAWPAR